MCIRDRDIARYADLEEFPVIPCNLCGSQNNLQRQVIKQMLQEWDRKHPGRIETIFKSMCNVVPSHLIDTDFFDFAELEGKQIDPSTLLSISPN